MSAHDPVRALQIAALIAVRHLAPGAHPDKVIVVDPSRKRIVEVPLPASVSEVLADDEPARVQPGWSVSETRASYDGKPVAVAPSRLRLLRVLAERRERVSAADLIGLAFDPHTSENNVRFHVGELRKELKAAFPGFAGEVIESGGGYLLELR